jgi:hypothetical protein
MHSVTLLQGDPVACTVYYAVLGISAVMPVALEP